MIAAVPAVADHGPDGVVAGGQQVGDVVDLIEGGLAEVGAFGAEQGVADALAVDLGLIDPQRRRIEAGLGDGPGDREILAQQEGAIARPGLGLVLRHLGGRPAGVVEARLLPALGRMQGRLHAARGDAHHPTAAQVGADHGRRGDLEELGLVEGGGVLDAEGHDVTTGAQAMARLGDGGHAERDGGMVRPLQRLAVQPDLGVEIGDGKQGDVRRRRQVEAQAEEAIRLVRRTVAAHPQQTRLTVGARHFGLGGDPFGAPVRRLEQAHLEAGSGAGGATSLVVADQHSPPDDLTRLQRTAQPGHVHALIGQDLAGVPQVRRAVLQQFAGAGGLDFIAGLLHAAVGALQSPRQAHGLIFQAEGGYGGGGLEVQHLQRRRLQGAGRGGGGGGGQTGEACTA
ncbi:hypothetical protein D3C85_955920 [compost metagenome]